MPRALYLKPLSPSPGSTSKAGGVHFPDDEEPPGSPTRRHDESNLCTLVAVLEKDGSYLVKVCPCVRCVCVCVYMEPKRPVQIMRRRERVTRSDDQPVVLGQLSGLWVISWSPFQPQQTAAQTYPFTLWPCSVIPLSRLVSWSATTAMRLSSPSQMSPPWAKSSLVSLPPLQLGGSPTCGSIVLIPPWRVGIDIWNSWPLAWCCRICLGFHLEMHEQRSCSNSWSLLGFLPLVYQRHIGSLLCSPLSVESSVNWCYGGHRG